MTQRSTYITGEQLLDNLYAEIDADTAALPSLLRQSSNRELTHV